MNWADMEAKFTALTSPCLGPRSDALFGLAREFSRGGVLPEMRALLARLPFEEEAA
jgi:hypothetical protein